MKLCEPEYLMKGLSGDMILPKVGEYNCYHEARSKPELILFWIRDNVAIYKKETQTLIKSGDIDINEMNRTDIVVGGDHGQGAFRFPMKILYIMNNDKRHEIIQSLTISIEHLFRICLWFDDA